MRKMISLLLAACLLFSLLAACGTEDEDISGMLSQSPIASPEPAPEPTPEPTPEGETAPVGRGYFDEVWRDELDFSEMGYEAYDIAWFEEYTAPIYALAANGGTAEEFAEADYWLTDEVYYVYTLYQLADLAWCRDLENAQLTGQAETAYEVYIQALEEYFLAMNAMALSEHAGLMYEVYHESYIEYFASYDAEAGAQQNTLTLQEGQLTNEYYALMSAETVDYDAAVELFVELVELRNSIASMMGYDNYCDYAYESVFYRDYSPADSAGIWAGVKEHFAPLVRRYQEKVWDGNERIMASGLDTSPEAILEAVAGVLPRIAPELKDAYEFMAQHQLYDIAPDPGKTQLGFTTTLYYVNQPFIFNAASGEFWDYMDTIHEFGHFANAYATMSDLIFGMADLDLSELQSQGLEMLFTRYYDGIFGDYAAEAEAYTLMSMIYSVVDGAMYDEFLQRVYTEAALSPERVIEIYAELYEEYGYSPYYGYEYEWVDVAHNFDYPFYYISYGVSALAALEIYSMMQTDWPAAVDTYMRVCAMDTEVYYFSQAIEEVGLGGIFDPDTYCRVAASLENALK